MKREFVILIILSSVFLAIGCAGNNTGQTPSSTGTPAITSVETPTTANSSETPAASAGGKTVAVAIQGFAFNPSSITISPGDTVKWTNMDSVTHTVTGDSISSGNLKNGDTYEQTFTKPGTYNYQCSIHPSMKGMIIVKE